jgi:hypothetical protein
VDVTEIRFHISIVHDPKFFCVQWQDSPACQLIHFPANVYCLLAAAPRTLGPPWCFSNARCDAARLEVLKLCALYSHRPTSPLAPFPTPIPTELSDGLTEMLKEVGRTRGRVPTDAKQHRTFAAPRRL